MSRGGSNILGEFSLLPVLYEVLNEGNCVIYNVERLIVNMPQCVGTSTQSSWIAALLVCAAFFFDTCLWKESFPTYVLFFFFGLFGFFHCTNHDKHNGTGINGDVQHKLSSLHISSYRDSQQTSTYICIFLFFCLFVSLLFLLVFGGGGEKKNINGCKKN